MEVKMDNEQKMISPEGEPVDYCQEFPSRTLVIFLE